MIQYLHHKDINKRKWDQCIGEAKYSIVYAYSWYLDIISPNWAALVAGDYETILPLTWRKKYGVYYLAQPLFAQQLGVFSAKMLNKEQIAEFLKNIPKRFLHYDITLNPLNLFIDSTGFKCKTKKTYHIKLNRKYDDLFQNYSDNTKRDIKKSCKNEITIKSIDVDDVITLYKENVWHKTPNIKLADFQILKKLTQEVSFKKKCLVLGTFENNKLGAGTIFYISDDKIIFIFGSSNKTGRKNGSMRFIFDWMIKNNCNKNLVLDFEGSSIDGLEYFYKSFGSERIDFLNINYSKFSILESFVRVKQIASNLLETKRIKGKLR